MELFIMMLIVGCIAGPAIGWMVTNTEKAKREHNAKREKFRAGQGSDPDKSVIGPHKPFAQNAVIIGVIFAVVGYLTASLVA